jgi:hypothetical protein
VLSEAKAKRTSYPAAVSQIVTEIRKGAILIAVSILGEQDRGV